MPGFRDSLSAQGSKLAPPPSVGELGGELLNEGMTHIPRTAALTGLGGAALGAGIGAFTGKPGAGAAVVGGAGAGGVLGAGATSAGLQMLARTLGPAVFKLTPQQTSALMHRANNFGTIAGGIGGTIAGGATAAHLMNKGKREEAMQQKAAFDFLPPRDPSALVGPEAYIGKSMAAAGSQHKNLLGRAGLYGAGGALVGGALADPAGGAGAGVGLTLGRAGGHIAGRGLGALAGLAVGRYTKSPNIQKLMDQYSIGGGHAGDVIGGALGAYKGLGMGRRLIHREGYEDEEKGAALRVLEKMGQVPAVPTATVMPSTLRQQQMWKLKKSLAAPMSPATLAEQQQWKLKQPAITPGKNKSLRGTLAAAEKPITGEAPAAEKTTGGQEFTADKAPGGAKSQLWRNLGLGTLGAGALGAGALGLGGMAAYNAYGHLQDSTINKYHQGRGLEGGYANAQQKQDFLGDQHKMDMRRQEEVMNRLKYPGAYAQHETPLGF